MGCVSGKTNKGSGKAGGGKIDIISYDNFIK